MSRQVRNRVTAAVLGGFLLGAALLTTGTANADQVEGGGRQVVFAGGGILGLPCKSTPSVESMTVPADGRVRLVNRTGHGARLRINGEAKGAVPDDGSTEVVFRHGTTAVTLDPSCAVPDQTTSVQVTTSPTSADGVGPTPVPLDPSPMAEPSAGTSSVPDDSGSASPDAVPTATSPQRTPPTLPQRTLPQRTLAATAGRSPQVSTPPATRVPVRATPTTTAARLQGGAAARDKTEPTRSTARATHRAFTGTPSGDDKKTAAVPPGDLPSPASSAEPGQSAGGSSDVAAAAPVASMRPMPESRPIGLLAVIAIVSVLGVGAGSIRAFASQRAYHANIG